MVIMYMHLHCMHILNIRYSICLTNLAKVDHWLYIATDCLDVEIQFTDQLLCAVFTTPGFLRKNKSESTCGIG